MHNVSTKKGFSALPVLISVAAVALAAAFFLLAPQQADAATGVNWIKVNDMGAVHVAPNTEVTVKVNVSTSGMFENDDWKSTEYKIEGGSWICVNTADHTSDGTYTESFSVNAPASAGTYDLTVRAYEKNGCDGDYGWKKLPNAFHVTNPKVCGDHDIDSPNDAGFYEECDDGKGNGDVCTAVYGSSCNYCTNDCTIETVTGPYCGDDIKNGREECDGEKGCAEDCTWEPATIHVSKVVCNDELKLPNWGDGGDNEITSTTASEWATHDGCELAEWTFQWAPGNTNNVDNNMSVAGGAWSTPFSGSIDVPAPNNKVWLREVVNSDYVPFSGDTSSPWDEDSAEFYCHEDVLNYDNYDYIENLQPGQDYYCVGFNALAFQPASVKVCKEIDYDGDLEGDDKTIMPGWEMYLQKNTGDPVATQTTGDDGCTTFTITEPGAYRVVEEIRTGYTSLNGDTFWLGQVESGEQNYMNILVNYKEPDCGDGIVDYGEECDGGPNCTEECTLRYDVHGYKWNDLNNNGEFDCESLLNGAVSDTNTNSAPSTFEPLCEPKLCDWTIQLKQNDAVIDETTTSCEEGEDYGWYWFEDREAGTYEICEVQQGGWIQTYPENCHEVTLPVSQETIRATVISDNHVEQSPEFDFGNYEAMCGNNILDEGEECDGREGYTVGKFCSPQCTLEDVFTLAKTDNKETAEPGELSTYEVSFGYAQEEHYLMMGGMIVDTLPANFTVDEATISDSGVYDTDARTITWDVEGAEHTFTFSGTIDEEMPIGTTVLLNTAELFQKPMNMVAAISQQQEIILPEPEPTLLLTAIDETSVTVGEPIVEPVCGDGVIEGDEACDDGAENGVACTAEAGESCEYCSSICTVFKVTGDEPMPVLAISKTAGNTLRNPSDTVAYTITVSNSGNGDALNVELTDVLPAGLTFANEDGTNSGETEKTWTWDTLAAGADVTVTYNALVDSSAAVGDYTNVATVSAQNVAGEISDDAVIAVQIPTVLGESTPELTVVKTANKEIANPAGTVEYTVVVTNVGDAVAYNATLSDVLPVGLVYAGTATQTEASWKLGDLVPTESVTVKYDAVIDISAAAGTYVNTAIARADDTPMVSDEASLEVRIVQVLGEETEPTVLPTTGAGMLGIVAGSILAFGSAMVIKRRMK
ncbi:MAG: hypothetical protein WC505_06660 [Patescibacteria group bacterium]